MKVTVYYEDLNYEEFVEEPEIAVCIYVYEKNITVFVMKLKSFL